MEGVVADRGVGQRGFGGSPKRGGSVHRDGLDVATLIGCEPVVKGGKGIHTSAGLHVDHRAGGVIADDGQIFVRVAIADLIDAEPVDLTEATLVE